METEYQSRQQIDPRVQPWMHQVWGAHEETYQATVGHKDHWGRGPRWRYKFGTEVVSRAMKLDKITKEMGIDRKKDPRTDTQNFPKLKSHEEKELEKNKGERQPVRLN